MRYSLEQHHRKYVQGQGFMSFARNIGNKYGKKIFDKSLDVGKSMKKKYSKKILDNSLSAGKDFAKIAGKKVLTKSAEATGHLIGNKVADRITKSTRNKEQKEDDRSSSIIGGSNSVCKKYFLLFSNLPLTPKPKSTCLPTLLRQTFYSYQA